jgi:hypothetical protein
MPHVVRRGRADLDAAWKGLPAGPWRWGRAVARVEGRYLAAEGNVLLVQGVVVEYGRPVHPVVMVTHRGEETAVHFWPVVRVERTEAVKRLLVQVAAELEAFGAGEVVATNLG